MTAKDLKNALLQEAVQGKLVPQIASEGNARDLLEEIRKEKLSHGLDFANAKSGKRKSKKETALAGSNPCDITEEEIPFDIPESWCWCRLGEVTEIARGGSPRPIKDYLTTDESGYNWIKIGDTDKNGKYINQTAEKIVKEGLSKTRLVHKGDFLLTNSMSFGRPYILNIDGCIHDGWLVISPKGTVFDKDFLYYVLSSTFAYNQFCDSVSGAVVKNLNSDKVRESLLPLPPLAEQKRIVAAIEKFMPLIEEYGKKETQLKAINEKIGTVTKKAILQEAVQGKLVPQIAAEGNARDLLEEIRKEKLSHGLDFANAKSGKRKSKKETALAGSNPCDITEEEIPFEIPENWCWCRWGDLSESIQYGYNAPAKETGRIKMVRISDIHENKVFWDSVPYCNISEDEIQTYILKKNDILFARTGGTVGKSFLVQDVPCEAIYAGYLIRTHYNSEKLVPQYLKFFMESNLYWEQLKEGTIATAQPNCNGKTLSKMFIPLPPLAEQKRIVEAIENLLPLCEALKI